MPLFLSLAEPDDGQKPSRQRLTAWLTLFSKFTNPKALYATQTLHAVYVTLLSHPEKSIQTVALSCILAYKSPISSHEDMLRGLLDDTRFRDELSTLSLETLEGQDRAEVTDTVIRLLFGIMLERKARSQGAGRRVAILSAIARCNELELGLLVDLMLRPMGHNSQSRRETPFLIHEVTGSDKQQLGFLTLLGDVMKVLGSSLLQYWPALVGAVIDITTAAQHKLQSSPIFETEVLDDSTGDVEVEDSSSQGASRSTRTIRQLGTKRLNDFFACKSSFEFATFMNVAFPKLISPRLPSFPRENLQSPSALLELFYTWSSNVFHVRLLFDYDPQVLPQVFHCLVNDSIKPAVISRILDIIEHLLALSKTHTFVLETAVAPHISALLVNLSALVTTTKDVSQTSGPLNHRVTHILSQISEYCTSPDDAAKLLRLFVPFLRKSSTHTPEKMKTEMLITISNLLPLISDLLIHDSETCNAVHFVLSQLFQSLHSRQGRVALLSTFNAFSKVVVSLLPVAELLHSLNSYSERRLDEPDFERRLDAFAKLNETTYKTLSEQQWHPILHTMLYFLQDPTELVVRGNASLTLKHFIELVSSNPSSNYEATFTRVLFPGLKKMLRSRNEMVRVEVLSVVAYAVKTCTAIASLQDMHPLLAKGDEEANFFNNILHVQLHRRTRALRRLADLCDEQPFANSTLWDILVPLISHFIASTSSVDHHVVTEAINTTGRLAQHLTWGSYNSLIQKYLRLAKRKDESERVYVRALVAILEHFHFEVDASSDPAGAENRYDGDDDDEDSPQQEVIKASAPNLPSTRICDSVNSHLLPTLLNFLESRDSTTEETVRIPIAIGVVTVANHLPET